MCIRGRERSEGQATRRVHAFRAAVRRPCAQRHVHAAAMRMLCRSACNQCRVVVPTPAPAPTLSTLPSLAHSERTSPSSSSLASWFSMNSSGLNMCFRMTVTWMGAEGQGGWAGSAHADAVGARGVRMRGEA